MPIPLPVPLRRRSSSEEGYNLVMLVVLITVMQIAIAMVLPLWSQALRREKEEQLIFRGLQYAEAIRVFQLRFGRLPVRLEELIEVKPRCIRQLWEDPMSEDGKWGIIFANAGAPIPGQPGQGVQPGGRDATGLDQGAGGRGFGNQGFGNQDSGARGRGDEDGSGFGRSGIGSSGFGRSGGFGSGLGASDEVAVGPIIGVHSRSDGKAVKTFMDRDEYSQWLFTVTLLGATPGQAGAPGGPAQGQGAPVLPANPPAGAGGRNPGRSFGTGGGSFGTGGGGAVRPGAPAGGRPGGPLQAAQPGQAPGNVLPILRGKWIGRPLPVPSGQLGAQVGAQPGFPGAPGGAQPPAGGGFPQPNLNRRGSDGSRP